MSNFYGSQFFGGGFFGAITTETPKTGTGGIDPKRRRTIVKPTGLIERKKPLEKLSEKLSPAQRQIEEIVQSNSDIHAEVSGRVYREFTAPKPIAQMFPEEVDREIGILLRKKLLQEAEEEEMIMLMAMLDE